MYIFKRPLQNEKSKRSARYVMQRECLKEGTLTEIRDASPGVLPCLCTSKAKVLSNLLYSRMSTTCPETVYRHLDLLRRWMLPGYLQPTFPCLHSTSFVLISILTTDHIQTNECGKGPSWEVCPVWMEGREEEESIRRRIRM